MEVDALALNGETFNDMPLKFWHLRAIEDLSVPTMCVLDLTSRCTPPVLQLKLISFPGISLEINLMLLKINVNLSPVFEAPWG